VLRQKIVQCRIYLHFTIFLAPAQRDTSNLKRFTEPFKIDTNFASSLERFMQTQCDKSLSK